MAPMALAEPAAANPATPPPMIRTYTLYMHMKPFEMATTVI